MFNTKITTQDIETRVNHINATLERQGKDWRVEFGHRYDYYALDQINAVTGYPVGYALKTGTKREIYTYLCGMVTMS